MKHPTDHLLSEYLSYCSITGEIRWLKKPNDRIVVGSIAGDMTSTGYRRVRVFGRTIMAHRLAWFLVFGRWPNRNIDHANRVKTDNSLANLREATQSQNMANRAFKPGRYLRGARLERKTGNWFAIITHERKNIRLGTFATEQEAHAAYCSAAKHLFGPFARVD